MDFLAQVQHDKEFENILPTLRSVVLNSDSRLIHSFVRALIHNPEMHFLLDNFPDSFFKKNHLLTALLSQPSSIPSSVVLTCLRRGCSIHSRDFLLAPLHNSIPVLQALEPFHNFSEQTLDSILQWRYYKFLPETLLYYFRACFRRGVQPQRRHLLFACQQSRELAQLTYQNGARFRWWDFLNRYFSQSKTWLPQVQPSTLVLPIQEDDESLELKEDQCYL